MLDIEIARADSGASWRLTGELTAAGASLLRRATAQIRDATPITVDLSGVRTVDRPGLGALVGMLLRARWSGAPVQLLAPAAPLVRLLREEGLDRLARLASGKAA
jgi:anti-anti-sigma regulatory factor